MRLRRRLIHLTVAVFGLGMLLEGVNFIGFMCITKNSTFNDFFNLYKEDAIHFWGLQAISLIIFLGLSKYFNRRIKKMVIQPIEEMEKVANAIIDENYDYKIEKSAVVEIDEVAKAFDKMINKLRESKEIQERYEFHRKELLANISHDIRTPITSIKLHSNGILDGIANTPEKLNKYIESINNKTEDIEKMISQLSLLSDLDFSKEKFTLTKVGIKGFLNDLILEMELDFEDNDVQLVSGFECKEDIECYIDINMMRRVVMNLVQNSIKYVRNIPVRILFDVEIKDDYCVVSVSDNGKGIHNDNFKNIFNRFFREDESRGTKCGSYGLGLSIVKEIIEKHKGVVWAEQGKNEEFTGLCINMKLPRGVDNIEE
ncbi:sensor histidine kinase [Oceanirhabdus sp. W0125-5]|uniref:sensor histidine kinase n=1 Tax=Oceanirhabdus sp. W0125-5 TaxID=2999116 RepID=UPI0022F2F804|nr:HAMP domain-containing sensor histidine kinase [Oceanirhabdus sp. W0125-5]WBW96790.1 HAMP domain-containing sensor histidine kinase [Oceanirhabdus sp. W0125-5]